MTTDCSHAAKGGKSVQGKCCSNVIIDVFDFFPLPIVASLPEVDHPTLLTFVQKVLRLPKAPLNKYLQKADAGHLLSEFA